MNLLQRAICWASPSDIYLGIRLRILALIAHWVVARTLREIVTALCRLLIGLIGSRLGLNWFLENRALGYIVSVIGCGNRSGIFIFKVMHLQLLRLTQRQVVIIFNVSSLHWLSPRHCTTSSLIPNKLSFSSLADLTCEELRQFVSLVHQKDCVSRCLFTEFVSCFMLIELTQYSAYLKMKLALVSVFVE